MQEQLDVSRMAEPANNGIVQLCPLSISNNGLCFRTMNQETINSPYPHTIRALSAAITPSLINFRIWKSSAIPLGEYCLATAYADIL